MPSKIEKSPHLAEVNRMFIHDGATLNEVLIRFPEFSLPGLDRHRRKALRMGKQAGNLPARPPRVRTDTSLSQKSHVTGDRCPKCAVSVEEPTPANLLKRAERFLWFAESAVFQHASTGDANRLLASLDRANAAMKLLMTAVGMIGDKGTVINITDARSLAITNLGKLSDELIHRLNAGDGSAWSALENALDS